MTRADAHNRPDTAELAGRLEHFLRHSKLSLALCSNRTLETRLRVTRSRAVQPSLPRNQQAKQMRRMS